MEKVIIDRFEEDYAVCEQEDKSFINIKKNLIPENAKEGDVLKISGESFSIDKEETDKRKEGIEELTKELWD